VRYTRDTILRLTLNAYWHCCATVGRCLPSHVTYLPRHHHLCCLTIASMVVTPLPRTYKTYIAVLRPITPPSRTACAFSPYSSLPL